MTNEAGTLVERLRGGLRVAMKQRDRMAVGVLRTALAAVENAGAVDSAAVVVGSSAIEATPVGAGATEVARRELTAAQVVEIVRGEQSEREAAAAALEQVGQLERAELLRAEARLLGEYL
ncbi:hypothetical protein C7C46_04050 [Streptomyces tateyamensis]|uniref:Glutamyl-tRNA amidotransferase n=1 Tax=Streptomyces tateyamensis TaxID=565073 RepID=A0A2V4NMW1_9ACTN|nr:hypothetical protein [Streptomyces tateyamensis]PYC87503.1 hypothetical protein C7C46_04050 [Streptomyces tateyamensis]